MSVPILALTAFSVVMVAMVLLTAFVFGLRALAMRKDERQPRTDEELEADQLDAELVAVLTAAAHAALGAPVRIHRVHIQRQQRAELWSRAGRMDIMVSHRVGPQR